MSKNFINIGLGVETGPLKSGMDEAVSKISSAGKKMEEAAVSATTKTEKSFSNLRQAYRSTAKDAYEIALQQGTQSAAFIEATQRAGQFKDELDLVNAKIQAFSSDTPLLTASLGVGQGLAGAFAAAQGAMGLFGADADKLQETMLKVQSAMALVQGLTALGGLKDSFMALSAVITARVVPAIASIGVTLSATGIGLAVVAVGVLVMAYKELSDESEKVAAATEASAKAQRDYNNSIYDYLATDQDKAIREENKKFLALKAAAEERKKALDASYKDLNKVTFGAANKAREEEYQKLLSELEGLESQHQKNIKEIRDKYAPKTSKTNSSDLGNSIKGDKNKFSDLKYQIKFTPIIDTDAIENLDGLLTDVGSELADSLNGAFSPINQEILNMELTIDNFVSETANLLKGALAQAFGEFGRIAGANLAGGNEDITKAAEAMLGQLAATIGQGMIAIGVPMLFSPLTAANGAALIAGGAALNVLAGAMGQSAKGGASSSGGGYSPSNSYSGFTPSDNTFSINSRLVGTDLLLSVQKSSKRMERVR